MTRKKRLSSKGIIAILSFIIVISALFYAINFRTQAHQEIQQVIEACEALPENSSNMTISGNVSHINYSFEAPEFLNHTEQTENGLYFTATDNQDLKSKFYVFIYLENETRNYSEEAQIHQANTDSYFWTFMKNNNHSAHYLSTDNETGKQNVITIQHTDLCGKYLEFNCAAMCLEKIEYCYDIFDSLKLTCPKEIFMNDSTYMEEYQLSQG